MLGWLKKCPSKLKIFVSHRVADITARVPPHHWRYVNTHCNPADLLSRGMLPADLMQQSLWWDGPPWLASPPSKWPRRPDLNRTSELPDLKPAVLVVQPQQEEYGTRFSSFSKMCRVTAWILRFNHKTKNKGMSLHKPYITLRELRTTKLILLLVSQRHTFQQELDTLCRRKKLPNKHVLSGLAPYVDSQGLLRVGGRLQQAGLSYDNTHPIILSSKSYIVYLLVLSAHITATHAGPSTLMAILAPTYHIIGLKRLIRKTSQGCVRCRRAYTRTTRQLMGELPEPRTQPARPFSIIGVNFAGPLRLKHGSVRKPTVNKCYVAVFICFVTRAVHLELVADSRL